jgi:hypothetical protein
MQLPSSVSSAPPGRLFFPFFVQGRRGLDQNWLDIAWNMPSSARLSLAIFPGPSGANNPVLMFHGSLDIFLSPGG